MRFPELNFLRIAPLARRMKLGIGYGLQQHSGTSQYVYLCVLITLNDWHMKEDQLKLCTILVEDFYQCIF